MPRDPRIVRQWLLLRRLEANPHGATLAALHEFVCDEGHVCHPRTVRRDLRDLDEAGFSLVSEDGRYRLVDRGTVSGRTLVVSRAEMVALLVAQQAIAGSPMEAALTALHGRVRAMLGAGERRFADELQARVRASPPPMVSVDADDPVLMALTRAVNDQQVARIRYRSPSSGETVRDIEPYLLWHARGGLYVVAHDRRSGQSRTFAVQRVLAADVLPESFEPDPTFDPLQHTRAGFGVFHGPKYRIEIEFSQDVSHLITERIWHHTQRVVATPDGVRVTWHMSGLVEIAAWVAGFGGSARVLGPPELAERVRRLHQEGLRGE